MSTLLPDGSSVDCFVFYLAANIMKYTELFS